MTNVELLLRETLTGLADEGRAPSMGERALAGARRRRRRHVVASGVITLIVLAVTAGTVLLLGPGAPRSEGPVAPPKDQRVGINLPSAVVAYYQDAMNVQQSWLLNPDTGRYEVVKRILLSVSPDLRYAIVAPCEPPDPACDSYGWYDVATRDVHDLGIIKAGTVRDDPGALSPGGSVYVFSRARIDDQDFEHLVGFRFVDMRTGEQHSVAMQEPDGWTAQDLVGWTTDGQYLIVTARAAGTHDSLGADLLYRQDGSIADIHVWPPSGATLRAEPVLGTNLIARMPALNGDAPIELRDAATGTVLVEYPHEQMRRIGMWENPASTVFTAWINDHQVVGQRGFNDIVLADFRTGQVRTVARIPGDGGFIHVIPAG